MRASFTLALTLASAATTVLAAPATPDALQRRAAGKLPFFFPKSVYERVAPTGPASFSKVSEAKAVQIATDFLVAKLGLAADEFKVANSFADASGTTHVYGAHQANGVRIANHQAAAHVQNGHVVSFSSSFGTSQHLIKPRIPPMNAKLTVDQAIGRAVESTGIPHHADFAAVSEYVNTGSDIVFAHKFQLRDEAKGQWVQVWADANTGEIVHSADFVHRLTYVVYDLPKASMIDGDPSPLVNPEDPLASPSGWADQYNLTMGNNAQSFRVATDGASPLFYRTYAGRYSFHVNPKLGPEWDGNSRASQFNSFYAVNVMHDISYHYGFTEAAGNFQADNFGKGGLGGDIVYVRDYVDSNSTDTAFIFVGADGQAAYMHLYRWTYTAPARNPGLDNTVTIHEYTHGISTRLTGGAATGQCLRDLESTSLGEGWSDFVALVLTAKASDTINKPVFIAQYSTGNPAGLRSYPYTTDMAVNPLKYSDLTTRTEPHAAGEVWVEMLWEMYWNLVTKYGFNANLYDAKSTAGNVVALQLVISGMMHQPCNPTIIQARDAILTADQTFYGGKFKCDIWKGFAKRGLGNGATVDKVNNFDLPWECLTVS
ncbi:hypothetical protein HK105_205803 [Polyrhizophydium stewartii]|uniref:Extracellular metalloproteinase n=1 Tax=Polyrhizophydium stewartii TaxID=2732419 RepID=A0ABR4N598_9FUNG